MQNDRQVMQTILQRLRRRLVNEAREEARKAARPFMVPRRPYNRNEATKQW
jgi:hypothetical protein